MTRRPRHSTHSSRACIARRTELPGYDFGEPLEDTTITENRVEEQLISLDTNKAPGPDGIHPYGIHLGQMGAIHMS